MFIYHLLINSELAQTSGDRFCVVFDVNRRVLSRLAIDLLYVKRGFNSSNAS
jgi:hypothetical protein